VDIAILVQTLTPYLPSLISLGQKAVEKGVEKLGEQGATELFSLIKKIWEKLYPKIQEKPAALKAVEDVAKDLDNEEALARLRQQLREILEAPENAELVIQVVEILTEAEKYSPNIAKFNTHLIDSQVGLIGDYGTVTMNTGHKF
jgi:hypothetical protein